MHAHTHTHTTVTDPWSRLASPLTESLKQLVLLPQFGLKYLKPLAAPTAFCLKELRQLRTKKKKKPPVYILSVCLIKRHIQLEVVLHRKAVLS